MDDIHTWERALAGQVEAAIRLAALAVSSASVRHVENCLGLLATLKVEASLLSALGLPLQEQRISAVIADLQGALGSIRSTAGMLMVDMRGNQSVKVGPIDGPMKAARDAEAVAFNQRQQTFRKLL